MCILWRIYFSGCGHCADRFSFNGNSNPLVCNDGRNFGYHVDTTILPPCLKVKSMVYKGNCCKPSCGGPHIKPNECWPDPSRLRVVGSQLRSWYDSWQIQGRGREHNPFYNSIGHVCPGIPALQHHPGPLPTSTTESGHATTGTRKNQTDTLSPPSPRRSTPASTQGRTRHDMQHNSSRLGPRRNEPTPKVASPLRHPPVDQSPSQAASKPLPARYRPRDCVRPPVTDSQRLQATPVDRSRPANPPQPSYRPSRIPGRPIAESFTAAIRNEANQQNRQSALSEYYDEDEEEEDAELPAARTREVGLNTTHTVEDKELATSSTARDSAEPARCMNDGV